MKHLTLALVAATVLASGCQKVNTVPGRPVAPAAPAPAPNNNVIVVPVAPAAPPTPQPVAPPPPKPRVNLDIIVAPQPHCPHHPNGCPPQCPNHK